MASLADVRESMLVGLMRWAPKRTFSSAMGAVSQVKIPRRLRRPIYRAYARRFGANLDEAELPLEAYTTLDEFFTRGLRPGVRKIDPDPDAIVSPCDGTLSESGKITTGRLIQAKGHDYRLESLIPDPAAAARFEGGTYVTIYLAPRDYHRVHSPVDGTVNGFQHVPGASFPVNALAVKKIDSLFAINERLITYMDSTLGDVAVVMVGATAVGRMSVSYDAVMTRSPAGRPGPRVRFASPHRLNRGEELGRFHLGSTVILLFQPGRVSLLGLAAGTTLRLGEPIARRGAAHAKGDAAA